MSPVLERRPQSSTVMRVIAPVIAALAATLITLVLLALSGKAPMEGFYALFLAPLATPSGWAQVLVKSAPLALIGAGLVVAFRARVWNIGAQGQYIAGAVAGSVLVIYRPEITGGWVLPVILLLGAVGGMVYAAVPAWLAIRFNANVILSTLMLDYVALAGLHYLTFGPWRNPANFGFPGSVSFPASASLPLLWPGTQVDLGVLLAFFAPLLVWGLLRFSLFGYQVRVSLSEAASVYAGFSRARMVWQSLLLSGGLAGLAGILQVAGPIGQLQTDISSDLGFAGIIVAYLAQLNPLGVMPAALLVGLFYVGSANAQITLGLSAALGELLQGILLLALLAANVLVHYRLRWRQA